MGQDDSLMKSESLSEKSHGKPNDEFNGVYGGWELAISALVLVFLGVMNTLYLQIYSVPEARKQVVFSVVMINLLGAFILLIPYIRRRIDSLGGGALDRFLALPDKNASITFPVVYDFLGGQALGGFLGTVLIVTTRLINDYFGVVAAGIYAFLLAMLAILIATLSLLRFIMCFTKYRLRVYAPASLLSLVVMFVCFWVGVKSASG